MLLLFNCTTLVGFRPGTKITYLSTKSCFRCFTCYPVHRNSPGVHENHYLSSHIVLQCQSELSDEIPAEKPSLIYQKRRIPKRPVEPRVYVPFSEAEDAFLLLCYEQYKYSFKEIAMRLKRDDASINTR